MKKRIIKKSKKSGFTLIELMLSVTMIAILTGATLKVATFSETQKSLTLASNEVRAAIRSAQSYALSIPSSVSGQHVCGFGFYAASADEYRIFYTYPSSGSSCSSSCLTASPSSCSWSDSFNTFKLSKELNFSTTGTSTAVVFKTPYGEVFQNGANLLSSDVTFTINNTKTNETRSIKVNGYGRIE